MPVTNRSIDCPPNYPLHYFPPGCDSYVSRSRWRKGRWAVADTMGGEQRAGHVPMKSNSVDLRVLIGQIFATELDCVWKLRHHPVSAHDAVSSVRAVRGNSARTSISALTSKGIHPIDYGAIRILLCDLADAKSVHKSFESLSVQVAVVRFSRTADFLLVQSFVLVLQASSLHLP